MKKTFVYIVIIFLFFSCASNNHKIKSQKDDSNIFLVDNDSIKLSINDFEYIIQDALNINHLDFLFTENEKSEGITIIINDLIKKKYKKLNLKKFNKEVRFLTHSEIYSEKNEKFLEIMNGSILMENDTLNVTLALRYKYTGINVKFINDKNKWKIITKNYPNTNNYFPNYRFKMNKEQCLTEQIKVFKNQKPLIDKCKKYNFEF